MGYRGVLILHGVRTVAVLILVTLFGVLSVRTSTIWCVFLIQVILGIRNRSSDASDVISHIVWGALALGHILPRDPRDPIVTEACLWFIALQGCLEYARNGWAMWRSTQWRFGEALGFIARHSLWRSETLCQYLRHHPELARVVTWATLIAEFTFPLVLLLGYPWCLLVLAGGALFHLLIALFMGLTEFPLSFLSTYPAIIFVVLRIEFALYA